MFRKIIALKLRFFTRLILAKYRPTVVAITGSVGKTTAKEAVFAIIDENYNVRRTLGNYNTEIGVPLTIIGADSGNRNIFRWLAIFWKALNLIIFSHQYPQVLVLEMGADRRGDLDYLTSFVKPDISIITSVGISHLEKFGSREGVAHEKGALVRALRKDKTAILNADDQGAYSLRAQTQARIFTYGFSFAAHLKAFNSRIEEKPGNVLSTVFEVSHGNETATVSLERSLGEPMVYAILAGIACALVLGMSLPEAASAASNFYGVPGRLEIIKGVNGSILIDDTYNSAPISAMAALKMLKNYPGQKKIAVLGKMAELGEESEAGHRQVGVAVANLDIDLLMVKDNEAAWIADEAQRVGFDANKIISFSENKEAAETLQNIIQSGDAVLLKASRSEFFEDIVKKVMAES